MVPTTLEPASIGRYMCASRRLLAQGVYSPASLRRRLAPGKWRRNLTGRSRLEVKGDRGDNDSRLTSQSASEPSRRAVVQGLVPAVFDDQLGQDDGEREPGSLGAQRVDVAHQRCDERAVRRLDDLKRQVIAPLDPVALEARCLVLARADVHGQHGLAQGGGVSQRTQAAQIEADDRHDRQVP